MTNKFVVIVFAFVVGCGGHECDWLRSSRLEENRKLVRLEPLDGRFFHYRTQKDNDGDCHSMFKMKTAYAGEREIVKEVGHRDGILIYEQDWYYTGRVITPKTEIEKDEGPISESIFHKVKYQDCGKVSSSTYCLYTTNAYWGVDILEDRARDILKKWGFEGLGMD